MLHFVHWNLDSTVKLKNVLKNFLVIFQSSNTMTSNMEDVD